LFKDFRELILRNPLLLSDFLDIPAHRQIDVLQCPSLWRYAAHLHPALKQLRKGHAAIN
jgi:hypothetical protein